MFICFVCKDARVCDDVYLNLLACKQMYLSLASYIKSEWCLRFVWKVRQFYQKMQSGEKVAM